MTKDKMKKIESLTQSLLKELGEDPEREGLIKTPSRVAKAWEYLSNHRSPVSHQQSVR